MRISVKTQAMLSSYGRVFLAAALAAFLTLGKGPTALGVSDLLVLVDAGIAALVITALNALRKGETRFGRGSADLGMGGEDRLSMGEGTIHPDSLPMPDPATYPPMVEKVRQARGKSGRFEKRTPPHGH